MDKPVVEVKKSKPRIKTSTQSTVRQALPCPTLVF